MSQLTARISALLLPALLMSSQAFGTTLAYKSFDDLVKEADAIVQGRVAAIQSSYSANHEIYTFVTFDTLSVLGGNYQGQTLTLRLKGGQVDNNISQIVGSPEFAVNDQVVLFVQGNGQYMVPVVGWTQGVFRVSQDAAGRQLIFDHEGNRVVGIRAGEVLKQNVTSPAANIVRPNPGIVAIVTSQSSGDGGTADNNSQAPAPATAAAPEAAAIAAMPTLTSQAFATTIKEAASAKTFGRELKSVGIGDFTVAGGNTDASVGPRPAAAKTTGSQSPAVPQRKAVPPPPRF